VAESMNIPGETAVGQSPARSAPTAAVVTGGGGGIGSEVVGRLLGRGLRVAVVDLEPGGFEDNSDPNVLFVECDVARRESVRAALGTVLDWSDRVTAMVTCAGVAERDTASDMSDEVWDLAIAVHLNGTFYWCQEVARHMRKAGGGAIVTIGSICADRGFPGLLSYGCAKAGVHQLTRGLAVEWAADNIRVNCVAPGYVNTKRLSQVTTVAPQRSSALHAMGRIAEPGEIADAAAYLLSDQASFITGQVLYVDGGFSVLARPIGW